MKNKIKIGDLYLITGKAHVEKTEVLSINDNIIKLKNNIILDKKSGNPLNSKMTVEEFDEERYEFFLSKIAISKLVSELRQIIIDNQVPDDKIIKTKIRLTKLLKLIKDE